MLLLLASALSTWALHGKAEMMLTVMRGKKAGREGDRGKLSAKAKWSLQTGLL
jgi:hypothetical protein